MCATTHIDGRRARDGCRGKERTKFPKFADYRLAFTRVVRSTLETLFARECGEFDSRDRSGYKETLYLMAPDRSQNLQLFRGFHESGLELIGP